MLDLPGDQAAQIMRELPRLCRAVARATACDGINVWQNNGPSSNQVVFHLHIHVIPRFHGDNMQRQIANRRALEPSECESIAAKIRAELAADVEPKL